MFSSPILLMTIRRHSEVRKVAPDHTQVQVHLVVGAGHGGHVEVSQPAELQLEGQGRLQVTVDAIFCKLRADRGEKTDGHTDTRGAGH